MVNYDTFVQLCVKERNCTNSRSCMAQGGRGPVIYIYIYICELCFVKSSLRNKRVLHSYRMHVCPVLPSIYSYVFIQKFTRVRAMLINQQIELYSIRGGGGGGISALDTVTKKGFENAGVG